MLLKRGKNNFIFILKNVHQYGDRINQFRLVNHKFFIQTFERSAALERVERLRLYLSRSGDENPFHQQRDFVEEHRHALLHVAQRQNSSFLPRLPEQKFPDIKCQYLTLHISTVVDVNHFWGQPVDRQTLNQMKRINDILSSSSSLTNLPVTSIQNGLICAAPFLHQSSRTTTTTTATPIPNEQISTLKYYRAKILHRIDNVTVEVFFLDWGNTEQIPIDQCLHQKKFCRNRILMFSCFSSSFQ